MKLRRNLIMSGYVDNRYILSGLEYHYIKEHFVRRAYFTECINGYGEIRKEKRKLLFAWMPFRIFFTNSCACMATLNLKIRIETSFTFYLLYFIKFQYTYNTVNTKIK